MFGDGISIIDLTMLLKAVREKNLVVQVKILEGSWEDLGAPQVKKMIQAITAGSIASGNDIRVRLFEKGSTAHT